MANDEVYFVLSSHLDGDCHPAIGVSGPFDRAELINYAREHAGDPIAKEPSELYDDDSVFGRNERPWLVVRGRVLSSEELAALTKESR